MREQREQTHSPSHRCEQEMRLSDVMGKVSAGEFVQWIGRLTKKEIRSSADSGPSVTQELRLRFRDRRLCDSLTRNDSNVGSFFLIFDFTSHLFRLNGPIHIHSSPEEGVMRKIFSSHGRRSVVKPMFFSQLKFLISFQAENSHFEILTTKNEMRKGFFFWGEIPLQRLEIVGIFLVYFPKTKLSWTFSYSRVATKWMKSQIAGIVFISFQKCDNEYNENGKT